MVIPAPRPSATDPPRPSRDGRRPRAGADGRTPAGRPDGPGRGVVDAAPGRSLVVLIGGHAEQGDDGAPVAAAATLLPTLPREIGARLGIRRRSRIEVEDLAALTPGQRFLLVDAASGPAPGTIVTGDLADLRDGVDGVDGERALTLRSLRHHTAAALIDGATDLRGAPIEGWFVAVAGHRWGFGTGLSPTVRGALPAFRDAIDAAMRRLATAIETDRDAGG